ncbi:MAG: hypothetical protein HC794_05670 [Nitrospiraceae bacterium]|nr:hypothetical protein [Nitrospiraceae bacterium]
MEIAAVFRDGSQLGAQARFGKVIRRELFAHGLGQRFPHRLEESAQRRRGHVEERGFSPRRQLFPGLGLFARQSVRGVVSATRSPRRVLLLNLSDH